MLPPFKTTTLSLFFCLQSLIRLEAAMSAVSLNTHLDMSGSECLNVDDDHPLENCLQDSPALLKSDCDEQLILALAFNQVVKIQSLKIRAPASSGPKTLRVFKNQPRSLDFSQAESFESVQVRGVTGVKNTSVSFTRVTFYKTCRT